MSYKLMQFQSTQPSQAVTPAVRRHPPQSGISIHTALAGCDTNRTTCNSNLVLISIHTALAGCDHDIRHSHASLLIISIHTALAGCDIFILAIQMMVI